MEKWVLLAAAGSGYLAHCWQKSKEPSSDVSDDDDGHSGPSCCITSFWRRHYHRSSFSRRLKASSNQKSLVSQFSNSVGALSDEHLYGPVGDDVKNGAQDMENGVLLRATSGSKTSFDFQTQLDAAISYPTDAESRTDSPRCTVNTLCAQKCGNFELFHQNQQGHRLMVAESCLDSLDCSIMAWYPSHFLGDLSLNGSGSMGRDVYPINLIDNAVDNNMANEEADIWCDGLWAAGYWNAYKDTSVLGMDTSFIREEHGGKRKVKPFQNNGRRRHCTGESKSLEGLPISSSDSCLSVRFGDEHSQEEIDGGVPVSSCGEQLFSCIGKHSGNKSMEGVVSDLPSERNESSRVSNKLTIDKSLVGEEALENSHFPCLPLQSKKRQWVNAWRECMASPGGGNFFLQGTGSANSLLKVLLFNFGVGVGMMFTILSNKHCTKQLIRPLEETLHLLQNLQDEVHGRTKLMFECCQPKDTIDDAWTEQISALFKVVTRTLDVVEQVKNLVSRDLACDSPIDRKHSKERAKLEAELEAELERMELNLNREEFSEFSQRKSSVSVDDLNIGNLVCGELSPSGIPHDAEVSSESMDSGHSRDEAFHNGVPPLELANRLCDLLVSRQEKEILELQAKVKHLDCRLQAKQVELQVWKQRALHVIPAETVLLSHRRVEPCCFSGGMHHSTFESSVSLECNQNLFNHSTEEFCSFCLDVAQPRTCFNDEADEGFDEISHFSSETASGSYSTSPNALFIGADAKENYKSSDTLSHLELESIGYINNAIDASLDSSAEFADSQTMFHLHLQDKLEHMEASSRKRGSGINWNGNVVPISEAARFTHDKPADCAEDIMKSSESRMQFRCPLDWSTSEYSSYLSDLDERWGQLLIKRIIEKGKRGSSIVEVAQSVMASFNSDETCSTTESSSAL